MTKLSQLKRFTIPLSTPNKPVTTYNNSHIHNVPRASKVDSNYSSNSDLCNNYNSNNIGNTIIINNNININAYIDKKGSNTCSNDNGVSNHYYYNYYENYNRGEREGIFIVLIILIME